MAFQVGNAIAGNIPWSLSGSSLDLNFDGSVLVVGAPLSDENGYLSGYANVYQWDGISWQSKGERLFGAEMSSFGNSVGLSYSGDTVVVGAPTDGASFQGSVRAYEFIDNSWQVLGQTIMGDNNTRLGAKVSISHRGDRIAAGAAYGDFGQVYSFDNDLWQELGNELKGLNPGDLFGDALHMSSDGNFVAVGGYANAINGQRSGHVRCFNFSSFTSSIEVAFVDKQFLIYPNPFFDQVIIDNNSDIKNYKIFDSLGHQLMSGILEGNKLELSNLLPGLYTILIQEENGSNWESHQLIKL